MQNQLLKFMPIDLTAPLPDTILDALAELYWDERVHSPAVAALRP